MAVPYKTSAEGKKAQVATMFNNIAKWYDFLNHFLTLGIDIVWRNKAIGSLTISQSTKILDIATGTADLALAAAKKKPERIIGIDISTEMIAIGKRKVEEQNQQKIITLQEGDSENLIFPESFFDIATSAFGVRNFENLKAGLKEIHRVLKPGGQLMVLEFSKPEKFPVKQLFNIYFSYILPIIGKLFSKDDSAYTYLPKSVKEFPHGQSFCKELENIGFKNTKAQSLSFGIASIYTAKK